MTGVMVIDHVFITDSLTFSLPQQTTIKVMENQLNGHQISAPIISRHKIVLYFLWNTKVIYCTRDIY